MSLSSALGSALSGLRFTSTATSLVGSNVANVDTPGYVKKRIDSVAVGVQSSSGGVRAGAVQRDYDAYVLRQLQGERSNAAFADVRADFLGRVDQLFGSPGSPTSLDTLLNAFTGSLQDLSASPESFTARSNAVGRASVLAQSLRSTSAQVQGMRVDAERAIGDAVNRVNSLLGQLESTNLRLREGQAAADGRATILDQRDRIITELSEFLDIRVTFDRDDAAQIITGSGEMLLQSQSVRLAFDGRSQLNPDSLYATNPALRGVGTISLASGTTGTDLIASGAFRSGKIAALIEIRDKTLTGVQAQLDEVAAALAAAMGTRTSSTAVTTAGPGPSQGFDMALGTPGLQDGDTITMTLMANGQSQRFTFKRVDDAAVAITDALTADPADRVVRLSGANPSGYTGDMQAAINAWATSVGAPSGAFQISLSGQTMRVLADPSAAGARVEAAQSNVTETSLTGGSPALPLFTDASTPFSDRVQANGRQSHGLAYRIDVNALVRADPSRLVIMSASPRTPDGDSSRPTFLRDAMDTVGRHFRPAGNVGTETAPFAGSVGEYLRAVIGTQGGEAQAARQIAEGQRLMVTQLNERYEQSSKVNIDEEMSRLIQLQNTYGANARVMGVVRDMFEILRQM